MLRKLSSREISDICVVFSEYEVKAKNLLIEQLKDVEIRDDKVIEFSKKIIEQYHLSKIEPGTAVGILSAQSIGEVLTQKTLNSIDYKERVLVNINGNCVETRTGKLIDNYFKIYKDTEHFERFVYTEKDSNFKNPIVTGYVDKIDVTNLNMKILGVDELGIVKWRTIEALVRHPLYNKLLRIKTRDGREVSATSAKSFLVRRNDKIVGINGSDLKIGDRLPVTIGYEQNISICDTLDVSDHKLASIHLDKLFGFFIGTYINSELKIYSTEFIKKICGNCPQKKHIPNFAYNAPDEFVKGLLEGYFNENGWIAKDGSIKCSSISERMIDGLICLLNRFRIYSVKQNKKSSHQWTLIISHNNIILFHKIIHSYIKYEQQKTFKYTYSQHDIIPGIGSENKEIHRDNMIKEVCPDVLFSEIVSIEEVDSTNGYVYDFTITDVKNFCILNGLNLMDTFHYSGLTIKTVVTGVPRFSELIGATKNPKYTLCKIFPAIPTYSIDQISQLCKEVTEIKFSNLISKIKFNVKQKKWYDTFSVLYPDTLQLISIEKSKIIRYKLNKKILYENKIQLEDVCQTIENYIHNNGYIDNENEWLRCVWSPINFAIIDIITNIDISSTVLEDILLYGISNINNAEYKRDSPTSEWYVEAYGSNIQDILTLNSIDKSRVMCNDMWKIYEYFGIEAARQFLINEISDIVSSDGTYVHKCNVNLLADAMTHTGIITSISRYSVKKSDTGVLSKASFEESFSNMVEGAQRGSIDNIDSVSSAVIVGRGIGIGTGLPVLRFKL